MQKGQAPLLIIVGILAVIFIASGAYYLGRSTTPKPSPTPSPSDASPAPTGAGETANWKKYDFNQKAGKYGSAYNFSIKYPADWQVREHDSGTTFDVAILSPDYAMPQTGAQEEAMKGGRIEISVIHKQKSTTIDNWLTTYYAQPYLHSVSKKPQQISITNDIQGIEFELTGTKGLNEVVHAKAFAIGDTVYLFQVVSKDGSERYTTILSQALSTFKFQ